MQARRTTCLLLLALSLTGCFDRGKPSGKLKYDDSTQGSRYDANLISDDNSGRGYEGAPPIDSTPIPVNAMGDSGWPPPKFIRLGDFERRKAQVGNILRVSEIYGVEPEFIHAIVTQESHYKPTVKSKVPPPRGPAVGLMQLIPATARRFECYDSENAWCNLNAGTRYLKVMLKQFNGNIRTVAAGYNAGEGAADSYLHGKKKKGTNPGGLKTPNGVPLASFAYNEKQRAHCPSNNWNPTPACEGQTYDYVRRVLGYYLTYKQHPELIGKTVAPAPSTVARHRGRV